MQPVNITVWYIHYRCCYGSLWLINRSDRVNVSLKCVLSQSHIFSIIFISGDCAGQESDFILFLSLYSTVDRALWNGALLSWKMKSFDGKYLAPTDHKFLSSISWYPGALRFPFTNAKVLTPQYAPDHYSKLCPMWCVHAFWLSFFSGFSPNVDTLHLHSAFITKYICPNTQLQARAICLCNRPVCSFCLVHAVKLPS